jgi:hypothetical protein
MIERGPGLSPEGDRLVVAWRSAVERLVRDHSDDGFFDWLNDLTVRDLVVAHESRLAAPVRFQLRRADAEFQEWTEQVQKPLDPLINSPRWWWFRVPKRMTADFREEVRAMGIDVPKENEGE